MRLHEFKRILWRVRKDTKTDNSRGTFGLIPLGQYLNADYLSEDGIFELKLRRKYRGKSGEHFTPSRRQLYLIRKNLRKDTWLDSFIVRTKRKAFTPRNFGYIFLTYDLPFSIETASSADDVVDNISIFEGFLADYKFVIEKDTANKEKRWYSITEKTLYHNTLGTRVATLLDSTFPLHLVSNETYIYRLARKFSPRSLNFSQQSTSQ